MSDVFDGFASLRLYGVTLPLKEPRRARLKKVFEGRRNQLRASRDGWGDYSTAVTKYVKARTAWRRFRGWA